MKKTMLKLCILVSALFAAGCGGGVSESGGPATPKYARLTFSLVSSSQPRVGAFSVELTLPQGVSAPLNAGTLNVLGTNGVSVMGTYSAPNRIHLSGAKADGIVYSSFAVMNCPLSSSGNSLVKDDFTYSMSGVTIPSSLISDIWARSDLNFKLVVNQNDL